jgi:hypothetical protein
MQKLEGNILNSCLEWDSACFSSLEMFTQVKMTGEMRKTRVALGIRQRLQKTEITGDFFQQKNADNEKKNVEWAKYEQKNLFLGRSEQFFL